MRVYSPKMGPSRKFMMLPPFSIVVNKLSFCSNVTI